jgi:hypothetical protein
MELVFIGGGWHQVEMHHDYSSFSNLINH